MNSTLRNFVILLLLSLSCLACRSDFEKIRSSGDTQAIFDAANNYYEEGEWQKAQSLYQLILSSFRGSDKAESVYFNYANTFYYMGQYVTAAFEYNRFVTNFPSSDKREDAEYLQAFSNFQLSPIFRLDQTYTQKAIQDFQLFVNTYPKSDRAKECNDLIDDMRLKLEEKVYSQGKQYFHMELYEASARTFENLIVEFPDTDKAEDVHWNIVDSKFRLAENSVYDKKKERFEKTKKSAELYIKKFPEGAHIAAVNKHLDLAINEIEKNSQ